MYKFALLSSLTAFAVSAAGPAHVAAWVAEQGGTMTADRVSLRGAWITDSDLDVLATIPHLKALDLSQTHITDLGLERLKKLPDVTELNLYYAERVTDEGIAHLKGWKKLERLNLRGTKITDTALEHISGLISLVALDAGFAQITDSGLDRLTNLTHLRELAIGGNKLSDSGLQFLKSLPDLTHLDISGSQRTDSGLWFVTVTDLGMEPVAGLKHLRELNLGGTGTTDLGLAKLKELSQLQSLDLSRTQVTPKGLETLLVLPRLEKLSLWKAPKIDDQAVPVLCRFARLKFLDASETKLSQEGLATLSKALPGVKVTDIK